MRVTLVPEDSCAYIDGRLVQGLDLSDMPTGVHAVQFNGTTGHVEYNNGKVNTTLESIDQFTVWVERAKSIIQAEDTVVVETQTAEQRRAKELTNIESTLKTTLDAGVLHNGKLWHTDETFQQQLTAFITAYSAGILGPTDTVTVRAKDNSINTLTLNELKALAGAVMLYVQTAYSVSWAAKDALV